MKTTIFCDVKEGKLTNSKRVREVVNSFEGKRIELTIQRARKRRSSPQNRYYWGCLIPIMQETFGEAWGEKPDKEAVHDFLKGEFNYKEVVNEDTAEVKG